MFFRQTTEEDYDIVDLAKKFPAEIVVEMLTEHVTDLGRARLREAMVAFDLMHYCQGCQNPLQSRSSERRFQHLCDECADIALSDDFANYLSDCDRGA